MAFKKQRVVLPGQPIELAESDLIGTGTRRYCFAYPSEISLCIKIPMQKKNGYKQQKREVRFYQQLASRGVPTDRITKYHGEVETSRGTGYIYDVVRDIDGSPSKQLGIFLKEQPERGHEFVQIMKILENYLFDNRVVFYDLNPWNILCKKQANGSLEPFIIDGVGDIVAIPVLNLSNRLLEQKIRRRWLRLIDRMRKHHLWMAQYSFTRD